MGSTVIEHCLTAGQGGAQKGRCQPLGTLICHFLKQKQAGIAHRGRTPAQCDSGSHGSVWAPLHRTPALHLQAEILLEPLLSTSVSLIPLWADPWSVLWGLSPRAPSSGLSPQPCPVPGAQRLLSWERLEKGEVENTERYIYTKHIDCWTRDQEQLKSLRQEHQLGKA